MTNLSFKVTYFIGNRKYEIPLSENKHFKLEYELTANSFKARIVPAVPMTLHRVDVTAENVFAPDDRFYGNGYQSWTTSKEYAAGDKMEDITKIAACKGLRNFAGISSDCRFVDMPKQAGRFYSHCYTYIRNGKNLNFIGSLSERQGFTVIYADMNLNLLTLSKDVEGVAVNKEPYELFDMVIYSGEYDEVFDRYFAAMGLKKPRVDHLSGYTSWYNYFQKIDENIITRDLNALDKVKESVNIFQIDDGYETAVGDWLERNEKKFPSGMKKVADDIHEKGYMAGLWLAPFNAQLTSKVLRKHPDWFIKGEHALPLLGCPGWGGAAILDIYNEGAREYIKSVFDTVFNDWGFDLVKLDFLYSQCLFPRNNKSRGTIMCEAMEFLRECCGDKLILGCGVPLGAAFGYVDACRIGCDVDLKFSGKIYNTLHINNEVPSAKNSIINAVNRRHLNGRAFCSDPDVFFLRYSNLDFTMEQKKLLAGINHLFGGVLFVSDNAEEYTDDDTELVKKTFAKSGAKVLAAEIVGDKGSIVIEENGEKKLIQFNLKTGSSDF